MTRCAIYDNQFNRLFDDELFIQDVKATRSKTMMTHIVEDGTVRADHFTTDQKKITLPIRFFRETGATQYARFSAAHLNNEPLIIQTDNDSFENMVLTSFPIEETPKAHLVTIVNCEFQEFVETTAVYEPLPLKKVTNAKNASTKKSGKKQGDDKTATQAVNESALSDVASGAVSALKRLVGG